MSRRNLAGWIADPHHVKPGSQMPAMGIDGDELNQVGAYLERLRLTDADLVPVSDGCATPELTRPRFIVGWRGPGQRPRVFIGRLSTVDHKAWPAATS